MRALLLAAAALAPLLAGCAAGDAEAPGPLAPTATTGVLRGVVVDEAIRPLAGANVTVPLPGGDPLRARTGEDGAFAFGGLDPGAYVVQASKPGYLDAQAEANVSAGDGGDGLRLVLAADALGAPAVEAFGFNGFLQCSVTALLVRVAACSPSEVAAPACGLPADPCGGNLTRDQFMAVHAVGRPAVRFLQSELVWDAGSQLSSSLRALPGARGPDGSIAEHRAFEGPSPLVLPMEGEAARALFIGNGKDLAVRVFSGYAEGTAPPACLPSPVGCPWGLGASYEQRFQLFTHVFYGFAPPPGWQFSRDGPPPVPS